MKKIQYKHISLYILFLSIICSCSNHHDFTKSRSLGEQQSLFYDRISTRLLAHYYDWQGTIYKNGGTDKNGIDCSGFTFITYKNIFGIQLPRSTDSQEQTCNTVTFQNLLPGDLLFFNTGWFTKHVGIFLHDDLFIHSSTSNGVTISSIKNHYWDDAFYIAKRCNIQ